APKSAPSAGASGAEPGPPPAPAGSRPATGATTVTISINAAQLRARITSEYARNSPPTSAGPGERPLPWTGVSQAPVLALHGQPDRVGALVLAASIGPGEPTAFDRVLARPVPGRAISAAGLAATRLLLRRPSVPGPLRRGMKGVDPTHVRFFADHCLRPAVLD